MLSRLLDELQHKYDNAKNDYQRKILKRLITILEEYIPNK
jgi:hypothetical protein